MKHEITIGGKTVSGIVCDSRQASLDTAFVCISGARMDGHNYAASAYEKGCRLFICERGLNLPDDAVRLTVPDTREAMAALSAELYGYPARKLRMIGVTGTKGKSTVATLLYETLNACGHKTALIGTTGIFVGDTHTLTANTTPDSDILHRTFSEALECGCECLVMEVSSQAYKMKRVSGIDFDIGIFTNLSPDHISAVEHADYAEYRECKSMLFENSASSILNADDSESAYMASKSRGNITRYSLTQGFDLTAENIAFTGSGSSFTCNGQSYELCLPGRFNISNALCVISACLQLGIHPKELSEALSHAEPVRGRFEPVSVYGDRVFIIDYAHNGISLETSLKVLREYNPARLICLFGSIGGRAELRRAELGEAASKYADFLIITSDNPDRENPDSIIAEIERSVGDTPHICITDRAEAIRYAVENSRSGDAILFAGKGHEDYQLINGEHVPFNERELIIKAAEAARV